MALLAGKVCVVTGAGKGIGRAISLAYAREGAKLILAARTAADLESVKSLCPNPDIVSTIAVDLSGPDGVDKLASEVLTQGGCDILVNNAGASVDGNALQGDVDKWDPLMYLNLNGPMRLTRALSQSIVDRGGGTIINMGSIAGIENMPGHLAVYAASKHGLRGWSTSIYNGLRHKNTKVMLINPAFVNTPLLSTSPIADKVIFENMIQPEDVAEVCLLPFRVGAACVPVEVTLRLTTAAMK
eukprot:m.906979 g.906979  ORF g.906979 m.906979 type:complete len:242 (+) comp23710_c0_seq2:519-1244(+)